MLLYNIPILFPCIPPFISGRQNSVTLMSCLRFDFTKVTFQYPQILLSAKIYASTFFINKSAQRFYSDKLSSFYRKKWIPTSTNKLWGILPRPHFVRYKFICYKQQRIYPSMIQIWEKSSFIKNDSSHSLTWFLRKKWRWIKQATLFLDYLSLFLYSTHLQLSLINSTCIIFIYH